MSTFSATANSNSTIGYAQYGSSSWSTGSSSGACQGAYQGTTAAKSRVGVMVFSGAGTALKGKLIQSITLTITSSGAGSGSSSKKLTFCQANYQSLNTGVRGSAQVGATLGTLTGKFYSNTVTHTLNTSSNAALFAAMKAYFEAGNSVLVLYNGETSSSSSYSSNYARVTSCTISMTYIDAVVWYRDGRHMAAMHGLVSAERRVGAGGSLLQFRRCVGARLREVFFLKELFEQVIQRRDYDLKSLLTCIDQYHIEGKLTDDERQELTQAAREGATTDYDYAGEINALWAAVRALQQSISPPAEQDEWPEYVQPTGAGTAYQVGDKVTFKGVRYVCRLPHCVWSPADYPIGWQKQA